MPYLDSHWDHFWQQYARPLDRSEISPRFLQFMRLWEPEEHDEKEDNKVNKVEFIE